MEADRPDRDDTEERWRSIVDNNGPRAELDDLFTGLPDAVVTPPPPELPPELPPDPPDPDDAPEADEERFEPPPPPPLPRVTPDRFVAWSGVFGSPLVLLVALVLGVSLPSWLGYLLVTGFVGGFGYLVYRMPRGPRDPWDDGAQV